MHEWSPEEDASLRELHAKGESASVIAAKFQERSRNAVIGRIHRLGLAGRATMVRLSTPKVRALPIKPSRASDNPIRRAGKINILRVLHAEMKAPPAPLPILDEPGGGAGGGGVSLLELESHHCRYPITNDLPHLFCGAQREDGFSYCKRHVAICSSRPLKPINIHPSETVIHTRQEAA